jgi:hypothetical protein
MTIKFIKGMSDQPPINIWSKEWPNWSGVVPQVGDTVLLHFGDNNEECYMFKVTHRFIDGTKPDVVTCMIAEEKMKTAADDFVEISSKLLRSCDVILKYNSRQVLVLLVEADEKGYINPVNRIMQAWADEGDTGVIITHQKECLNSRNT